MVELEQEETAYQRLYNKLHTKKRQAAEEVKARLHVPSQSPSPLSCLILCE